MSGPERVSGRGVVAAARNGWLNRMTRGLRRSAAGLSSEIGRIFTGRAVDASSLEALEEALIAADLGAGAAAGIVAEFARQRPADSTPDGLRAALADRIADRLRPVALPLRLDDIESRPAVILLVGVNGSGKTTTTAKLGAQFAGQGKAVVLAAGDTFRAAAIDQLRIWGDRTGCPVIARQPGADPAAVAYEALTAARRDRADVLLIDTAGRLHNRADLMAQLQKIVKVLGKIDAGAPHRCLLVLDAATGQNAIAQVQTFRDLVPVSGLIVTRLDGTARGGVVVALADRFRLPIHGVGVGEAVDDLQAFDPDQFARALLGMAAA